MGTWSAPDTPAKKKKLKAIIKQVDRLQKALYPVFGDDMLFDSLEDVKDQLNSALKAKWISAGGGLINMVRKKK